MIACYPCDGISRVNLFFCFLALNPNIVSLFYNESGGWHTDLADHGNPTVEACLFEDLRLVSIPYLSQARLKVNRYIANISGSNIFDFVSGPIQ